MLFDLADPKCDVEKILEEFAEKGVVIWHYQSEIFFRWSDLSNWLKSSNWIKSNEDWRKYEREINNFTDQLIQIWLDTGLISYRSNRHLQYYYERKKK